MKINITPADTGKTVIQILKGQLSVSSKMLTKLKQKSDGILVNGEHATVRKILNSGDILEINDRDTAEEKNPYLIPIEGNLDIIYEDDDITVVNKPPYMPTHTSLNHKEDTLANFLAYRYKDKESYIFRPVNRLDKDTSGLVLTANNKYSASRLSDMIQKGKIEKRYLALLDGEISQRGGMKASHGIIDNFIMRKYESIIIREQSNEYKEGAHRAVTEFRCIDVKSGISAVEAIPKTGRTHQLRVHFSSVGCPIIGDDLYGSKSDIISRQALHAYKLKFQHPITGELLILTAPIPDDINKILKSRNITI